MWHSILVFFGIDDEAGPGYGFWSGAGSDIGEVALIGLLYQMVRRHNCHVRGCLRIGRHKIDGTPHTVCRRHHPDGHLTADDARNSVV